jgi:hypothetical protein
MPKVSTLELSTAASTGGENSGSAAGYRPQTQRQLVAVETVTPDCFDLCGHLAR